MRIVQIIPGSGGRFYCENCARDDSLTRALRARGHEVIVGSLYLPTTEPGNAPVPLFYGAVNLYLGQRFPAFRSRLFDLEFFLRLAGRLSGATAAADLEELTLSMLRGEEGGQAPELERLVRWLAEVRPEVVHLSNCLLLGTARRIRRELGIPLVCSLQDEDTWIDAMRGPARARAWQLLRERAADVDVFTPVSGHYARFMAERLGVPEDRLTVVPIGIDIEGFPTPRGKPPTAPLAASPTRPPAIGFLAHVSESMGAGLLAEAFLRLSADGPAAGRGPASFSRFPGLELRFMGGSTAGDAPVLRAIRRSFARHGLLHRLKVYRSFTRPERIRFLSSLTVVSVPVPGGEAFGTFQLEAMAAGVPVVQPRLGGFPEVVEATGGGILYEPNTPEALAAALGTLLADPSRARALGRAGREAVLARYTAAHMAAGLEQAFAMAIARRLRQ